MPLETVIGEDAAQVRVAGEQDAVHVVGFALEPVGAREDRTGRGDGFPFGNGRLDADALVLARRQKVVHHVEARGTPRPVHTAAVDIGDELALRVVTQEGEKLKEPRRRDVDRQLVIGNRGALDEVTLGFRDIVGEIG